MVAELLKYWKIGLSFINVILYFFMIFFKNYNLILKMGENHVF